MSRTPAVHPDTSPPERGHGRHDGEHHQGDGDDLEHTGRDTASGMGGALRWLSECGTKDEYDDGNRDDGTAAIVTATAMKSLA